MTVSEERVWKCAKCGVELITRKTIFNYMERTVSHEVPVCPKCGKATRVAHKTVDGKNVRACKKCGETI